MKFALLQRKDDIWPGSSAKAWQPASSGRATARLRRRTQTLTARGNAGPAGAPDAAGARGTAHDDTRESQDNESGRERGGGKPCSRVWALARPPPPRTPSLLPQGSSRPALLAPLSGPAPRKLATAPARHRNEALWQPGLRLGAPYERRRSPGRPDWMPLVTAD